MTKAFRGLVFVLVCSVLSSCTFKKAELGTADNPIKLFFVLSVDANVIDANSKDIKDILEATTPYKYVINVPQSFIAVVESFGSNKADVAAMNSFGYIVANQKYGAEAKLTVIRFGSPTYKGQIIARTKDNIKDVKGLAGKKFAFVDPASTSGYLLPMKLVKAAGVKLGETIFAMKHDNVVSMVYQGQVDAGATFHSPAAEGVIQDARRLVKTQYPDVEQKISIITLTEEIPNDPIVFRKDMPEEMKNKIATAFLEMSKTEKGKAAMKAIYGVTEMKMATDKDYDGVRQMLKDLGTDATELVPAK